uniref:LysR family transcriptional regulator n=1 Tax=Stappia sp. TaxID=1870903 RepID=UPI003BA8B6E7
MTPKLDIGALQALCAIRDHGGVTRAAHHLGLSQSAVSHKIRRLEEGLGCTLLNRRPGQSVFTPEGERLLHYARRILAINNEAVASLSTDPLSGLIRLGITEQATHGALARVLGHFTRLQPDVTVLTDVAQSLTIATQLDRGEIDIGIFQIFRDRKRHDDLLLSESELVWAKSRDLELDWQRPIPFLAFDDTCFYRRWVMEACPLPPHGFSTVMRCASLAGILSALKSGLGVTLISADHVGPEIEAIADGFAPPPHVATVVRVGRNASSRAVQALARQIMGEEGYRSGKAA